MIYKALDSLRVLHGVFSSIEISRSRIFNTASEIFREKMCQVMLKKPLTGDLFICKEVFGE